MSNSEAYRAATAQDLIKMYDLDALAKDRKEKKELQKDIKEVKQSTKDFVEVVDKEIKELQDQVDGKISTWFFTGVPNTETEPEVNWITSEDKQSHIGDIYYNQDTGDSYVYKFINNEYVWDKNENGDAAEALAKANAAQDTADRKRQIFVVEPFTPYDVGDLWIKEDKEFYRCRAKRTEGDYSSNDWIPAAEYTNDDYAKNVEAQLNTYKELVSTDYVLKSSFESTTNGLEAKVTSVTTIIEEVKTDLNDNYYNKTEVDGNYYDKVEIDSLNGNLNDSINSVSSNLSDNYYKKNEVDQVTNEISTNVTSISKTVTELTTDVSKSITFIEDVQVNGVNKLKTENSYIFDKDGLHMDDSTAKTKNTMNNTGMSIEDKTSVQNKELLFAGYDENLNDSIVRTNNLTVKTYLTSGSYCRFEDYQEEGYAPSFGAFYMG